MNLFFKIQTLQLLIFCKDDREFVANLDYVLLIFLCNIIKFNHFCIVSLYCYIQSLLFHLLQLCLLHMYIFLLSQLIIFFYHHLKWKQSYYFYYYYYFYITSSVKTLSFSLLNLCCVFNIYLFFFMNSLFFFIVFFCNNRSYLCQFLFF